MKKQIPSSTLEATQIVELLSELNNKVRMDESLTYVSDDQYEQIAKGINDLTINIYNHKLISETAGDRMDELTDMMTSMAALDFSKKAHVTEEENHLDYIAIGLNLMNKQLSKATAVLKMYGNIIENLKDLIIVLDEKGKIEFVNESVTTQLGFEKDELIGRTVNKLFPFKKLLEQLQFEKKDPVVERVQFKLSYKNGHKMLVPASVTVAKDNENNAQNIILLIPFTSLDYSFQTLKSLIEVMEIILNAKENKIEKHEYRESLKMTVEEIRAMVS